MDNDLDLRRFLASLPGPNDLPALDLTASILLLFVLWIGRLVAVRLLRSRSGAPPHVVRRWVATIRNVFLVLLLVGLVLIWAPQLRTFALSLTAVAVALVVATKELILCVSGSVMRASSRAFAVGDWIEVAGIRGEVVDHTILATTLQEFEPGSFHHAGRTVVLPNSTFFVSPVRNLSIIRDHTFHSFSITVEPGVDLVGASDRIAAIVEAHYGPHFREAVEVNARIERRTGIDLREAGDRIRIATTDLGKYRVTVTLFCPTAHADALEDAITRDIISLLHGLSASSEG